MSEFHSQLEDVLAEVEERNKQQRREATKYGAQLERSDDEEADDR